MRHRVIILSLLLTVCLAGTILTYIAQIRAPKADVIITPTGKQSNLSEQDFAKKVPASQVR